MFSRSILSFQLGLISSLISFVAFAGDEVRVAWAYSVQCPPVSGCYKSEGLRGVVEVKNVAFEKKVDVVYKSAVSSQWLKAPAEYLAPADDGYEAWSFNVSGAVEAFAVSYFVNGQTYWDNNSGQDFKFARYRNDARLGQKKKLAGMYGAKFESTDYLSAFVFVDPKQLAQRAITVSLAAPGASLQSSANLFEVLPSGVEVWSARIPVDEPLVESEFRISAEADGVLDDNYGLRYRLRDRVISLR